MVINFLGDKLEFNVRVFPKGVTWRRHLEPLRPRHGIQEDDDPGDTSTHDSISSYSSLKESYSDTLSGQGHALSKPKNQCQHLRSPPFQNLSNHQTPNLTIQRLLTGGDYGPENLRRSIMIKK